MTEPSAKHVIVIGAGATGLTAAYLLAESGASVTVLEAGAEPGGSSPRLRRAGRGSSGSTIIFSRTTPSSTGSSASSTWLRR